MVRAAAGLLDDRTAGQVVVARTAAHEGRDGRRGARRRAGAGGWSAELGGGGDCPPPPAGDVSSGSPRDSVQRA